MSIYVYRQSKWTYAGLVERIPRIFGEFPGMHLGQRKKSKTDSAIEVYLTQ